MNEKILTPEEAAEILRIRPKALRRLLREKRIRGAKIGGAWRIRESDLKAALDAAPAPDTVTADRPAQERSWIDDLLDALTDALRQATASEKAILLARLKTLTDHFARDEDAVSAGTWREPELRPTTLRHETEQSLLDVPAVARKLSLDERTVRRWTREGRFPGAYKIGNSWRYEARAVDEFIKRGGTL